MSEIFHLKYRPKTINQLDLELVRERLGKIFAQKYLPHSFLFAGPKGTGKTSAARVLAKSLNCPQVKKGNPCGRCSYCLEIERGESFDVLEIDAASNRGIDDIRQIREKVGLQPLKAKNKIYIVDEVHMLTKEAFNAILKTLEEPPSHVYFVFCTTNPEKIPPTVMSRLTVIDFPRGSKNEIVSCLKRVTKGEKINVKKGTLEQIADISEGSFRDAHKIFYQLWLESSGRISERKSAQFFSQLKKGRPEQFITFLAKGELRPALLLLEDLALKGVDFSDYGRKTLLLLQTVLLSQLEADRQPSSPPPFLVEKLSLSQVVRLSQLVAQAMSEQKTAVLSQLPLQLAAVSFLENNIQKKGPQPLPPEAGPAPFLKAKTKKAPPVKEESSAEVEKDDKVTSCWPKVLAAVKPKNHSVEALLRSCRPLGFEGDWLVLEVFYQFHKDRLAEEKNRRILEEGLTEVFGRSWRIKYILGSKSPAKSPLPSDSAEPVAGKEEDLFEVAKEIFGE